MADPVQWKDLARHIVSVAVLEGYQIGRGKQVTPDNDALNAAVDEVIGVIWSDHLVAAQQIEPDLTLEQIKAELDKRITA